MLVPVGVVVVVLVVAIVWWLRRPDTVTVTHRGAPVKSYDLTCESTAGEIERHVASVDGTYKLERVAPSKYLREAAVRWCLVTKEA
jgi:hypothetical protein